MNLQHKQQGTFSPQMLRLTTGLVGMCLAGYIAGPPIYWHLSESMTSVAHYPCPPCHCDCNDESFVPQQQQGTRALTHHIMACTR